MASLQLLEITMLFSQLLKSWFTAMVTYSFHLYSRSSHHFIQGNNNASSVFFNGLVSNIYSFEKYSCTVTARDIQCSYKFTVQNNQRLDYFDLSSGDNTINWCNWIHHKLWKAHRSASRHKMQMDPPWRGYVCQRVWVPLQGRRRKIAKWWFMLSTRKWCRTSQKRWKHRQELGVSR